MTTERLVWDLPLRLFHWLLVVSVLGSWITGKVGYDVRQYHMLMGYWMLGLLLFRLFWGVVGSRHSRFASFMPTPASVARYIRDLVNGTAKQSVGHNPIGSLMVFAMILLLLAQAISGLFLDDEIIHAGPYASVVTKQVRGTMDDVHEIAANFIAILALIHVLAVFYHKLKLKEPLIRAMFTGKKPSDVVPVELAIASTAIVRGLIVAIVAAGVIYWLVAVNPA